MAEIARQLEEKSPTAEKEAGSHNATWTIVNHSMVNRIMKISKP